MRFLGIRYAKLVKRSLRHLMNGIAPHGSSIILSGGYQDDEDLGDVIIYTGEGGRDPNTRRQIADQTFTNGNLALAANHLNGIPIRVHPGRKHAPDMPQGFRYRYDGLYRVASYWQQIGSDGFKIWRFRSRKRRFRRTWRIRRRLNRRLKTHLPETTLQLDSP